MKKRIVGIYANYDASEQSLCAEFLAGYIVKCYRYVRWIVPDAPGSGSRSFGFSHQWDTEVVSWHTNLELAKQTAEACDTFFFFEPQENILDLLPDGAVTAFVVNPSGWSPEHQAFARRCTYSLLPGTGREPFPFRDLLPNTIDWPFDPSVQCLWRPDLDYERAPRLFFPAFGFTEPERQFVIQVAEIVRLCKPNVRTVVGFYDAQVEPCEGIDSRTYDWRLLRYLQNSDWVIDLNRSPVYSLFAAFAGGYGLQWIGLEIAPNTDPHNAARRHLIREPVRRGGAGGCLHVEPDLESTARQIVASLGKPFHGDLDRHHGCGAWDNRRAEFLRTTNSILGIKTRY